MVHIQADAYYYSSNNEICYKNPLRSALEVTKVKEVPSVCVNMCYFPLCLFFLS